MLEPGDLIADRYRVVRHLGSGGMGDVFVVEHTSLGRAFALKRLNAHGAGDQVVVERFLREARTAASTGHPGVVEVFDLGFADDGQPFLVMELLAGLSLRDRLRQGPVPEAGVVQLARGMLQPLAAVHAKGVIHRDIKPDNVFLPEGGAVRVKLLDFGLARSAQGDTSLTHTGAILGTPLYMSPEQARAEALDARADLYAVAAVLFECVWGKPPFTGTSYGALLARVLTELPDPAKLRRVSPQLQALILRGLEKDPRARPASAQEMLDALSAPALSQTAEYGEAAADSLLSAGPLLAGQRTPRVVISAPDAAAAGAHAATLDARLAPVFGETGVAAPAGPDLGETLAAGLPGDLPGLTDDLVRLPMERVAERVRRASLRARGDLDLAARAALVTLFDSRKKGYKAARRLAGQTLPPWGRVVIDAILSIAAGESETQIERVQAAFAQHPDDVALGYLLGRMLFRADRFPESRAVLEGLLARWPSFEPALNELLEKLLILGDVDDAEELVETFIAHAPDGALLDMFDIELLIGHRDYRRALQRVLELERQHPGREKEFFQFKGDLYTLLRRHDDALQSYDQLGSGPRRDYYVSGVLLHMGRVSEARALLLAAIERYPGGDDQRLGRLGTLSVDAAQLALREGDVELAERVLARCETATSSAPEARWRGDVAWVRGVVDVLRGHAPTPERFPLGATSPHLALLRAHGASPQDALVALRPVSDPAGLHFGKVNTNVLFPLFAARADAASRVGAPAEAAEALRYAERVVEPRHFDSSRGLVLDIALEARARAYDTLGRTGEAAAVRSQRVTPRR